MASNSDKLIPTVCLLPPKTLALAKATLKRVTAVVLRDAECNTDVVTDKFIEGNGSRFEDHRFHVRVVRSKKNSSDTASSMIVNTTLGLEGPEYVSSWKILDGRCDLLLKTPWRKSTGSEIDYGFLSVSVKDIS